MLKSPWVVALILIVVLALLFWLVLRGGKRFVAWAKEPVEPDKPRWTYVLTPLAAALAPLAAFSALLPSYLNQQRADSKFMAEAQQTRTDAQWYRIRQDTESQEGQFNEAEARFGSPDEKTRAIAALQVADLALLPKPGASGAASAENYPHFSSVGSQIAVALQMEQNPDVRASLRQAMGKMVTFAAEKNNAGWQIGLTNQLADANRRVQKAFTESLGRYGVTHDLNQRPVLQNLALLAPFSTDPETTLLGIRDLTRTETFQASRQIGAVLRAAATETERRQAEAALVMSLQSQASHLMEVRDTLAETLRVKAGTAAPAGTIALPGGLPAIEIPVPVGLPAVPGLPGAGAPASAPAKPAMNLANCFLVGANLWQAHMNNGDVTGTNFTGANLKFSDLTGANVEKALRLPVSVTKCAKGPDADRLPTLKARYPHFPWADVEQRVNTAAPKAAEPKAAEPKAAEPAKAVPTAAPAGK